MYLLIFIASTYALHICCNDKCCLELQEPLKFNKEFEKHYQDVVCNLCSEIVIKNRATFSEITAIVGGFTVFMLVLYCSAVFVQK